ncbi:ArsR/SmtB family transcription factor [Streptomyces sp. NPDC056909]|uniref:ArsR/SmtB family transcription factor n=1 Tax=Streptomyces sp. NPDC056909 TaxID=3345963 RepID=UPI0036BD868C
MWSMARRQVAHACSILPRLRCVSAPATRTGAKQTNLSNHLRVLREAGVVETEPCGRFTYYKLRPDVIESVAGSFTALATAARATRAADTKRACP